VDQLKTKEEKGIQKEMENTYLRSRSNFPCFKVTLNLLTTIKSNIKITTMNREGNLVNLTKD